MDIEDMETVLSEGSEPRATRKFKRTMRKLSKVLSAVKIVLSTSIPFLIDHDESDMMTLMLVSGPSLRRPVQVISVRVVKDRSISFHSIRQASLATSPASQLKKVLRSVIQMNEPANQPISGPASKKLFVIFVQPSSSPPPDVPEGCVVIERSQQTERMRLFDKEDVIEKTRGRGSNPRMTEIVLSHHDPFSSSRGSKDQGITLSASSTSSTSAFQINRPIKRVVMI